MDSIGRGIAIVGIWIGSALAIMWGGCSEIFIGATIATILVTFSW